MIQESTLNLDVRENFLKYMGGIWANIFKQMSLDKKGIVAEVGPGFDNKIGWGLSFYDFSGTFYVIEPDKKALDSITEEYKKILPKANIIGLPYMLSECPEHLPKKIDAIVANHPLDDMIIGKFLGTDFEAFFTSLYNTTDCKTKIYWNQLDKYPEKIKKIKKEVISDWIKVIKSNHPGFVCISQYESYFLRDHGVLSPDKYAFSVLENIRKKFNKEERWDIVLEDEKIDVKKRWLVLDFSKLAETK